MTMVPEFVLKQCVSETCSHLGGVGYVYGDRLTLLDGEPAALRTFLQTATALLARPYREFFRSIPFSDELQTRHCPLGLELAYVPLDEFFECAAGCVVFLDVSAEALTGLPRIGCVTKLPRKQKKQLLTSITTGNAWTNAHRHGVEGTFGRLRERVRSAVEDYRGERMSSTLLDYENFVASFSHEALTPIQEIRSSLELAVQNASGLDEAIRARLQSSLRAMDSLRVSLEGMRLLFREDEKPLPNQFRFTDLREVVMRWCEIYRDAMDQKNIRLYVEPSVSWEVRVVPEYIEVLVKNLISNAVKYSFDCREYSESGKVLIRFDAQLSKVSFVSFGVPIPQEEIRDNRLLEFGQRGATADDRGRVGKGVGMHLVGIVARLHDAEVTIESEIKNPGGYQQFARNEIGIEFPRVLRSRRNIVHSPHWRGRGRANDTRFT